MRCLLCPLESALLKEAVAQHSAQVLGGGLHAEEPALPSAESRRRIHPDSHPGAARPSNDDGPKRDEQVAGRWAVSLHFLLLSCSCVPSFWPFRAAVFSPPGGVVPCGL